jgi:hypothetical protein
VACVKPGRHTHSRRVDNRPEHPPIAFEAGPGPPSGSRCPSGGPTACLRWTAPPARDGRRAKNVAAKPVLRIATRWLLQPTQLLPTWFLGISRPLKDGEAHVGCFARGRKIVVGHLCRLLPWVGPEQWRLTFTQTVSHLAYEYLYVLKNPGSKRLTQQK